jgi:hypothetical protein
MIVPSICSMKDFFSEENPKNYGDMYKNFTGLIETINSNVLFKLDGSADAAAAKKTDSESSSSMQRYSYVAFCGSTFHSSFPRYILGQILDIFWRQYFASSNVVTWEKVVTVACSWSILKFVQNLGGMIIKNSVEMYHLKQFFLK